MPDLVGVLWSLPGETRLALVLISALGLVFHVRFERRSVAQGPGLLTTCGIFFTFLGLAQGLLRFDPGQLFTSIPDLLAGLRTAFWASVAGVFWALTLKLRD